MWGKFVVGFRISAVLTSFLLWPLLLGTALNNRFWTNWEAVALFFAIVLMVCFVNSVVALVCSLFQRKTSTALMSTYVVLLLLYVAPPAIVALLSILEFSELEIAQAEWLGVSSPFSAVFSVPLDENLRREYDETMANPGNVSIVVGYFLFSGILLAISSLAMILRLRSRRGLSE